MGRSKRAATPPTPKAPPPPVQEVTAELIAPTMRQEIARRQARGAYATKGQTLGSAGQVLGASPTELAPVRQATGGMEEKATDLKTFGQQQMGKFGGKTMSKYDYVMSPTYKQKASNVTFEKRLQDKGRQGRNARQIQTAYNKYLKALEKQKQTPVGTKGQTI